MPRPKVPMPDGVSQSPVKVQVVTPHIVHLNGYATISSVFDLKYTSSPHAPTSKVFHLNCHTMVWAPCSDVRPSRSPRSCTLDLPSPSPPLTDRLLHQNHSSANIDQRAAVCCIRDAQCCTLRSGSMLKSEFTGS